MKCNTNEKKTKNDEKKTKPKRIAREKKSIVSRKDLSLAFVGSLFSNSHFHSFIDAQNRFRQSNRLLIWCLARLYRHIYGAIVHTIFVFFVLLYTYTRRTFGCSKSFIPNISILFGHTPPSCDCVCCVRYGNAYGMPYG